MASMQQGLFPWYSFDREEPDITEYIPANYDSPSSYEINNDNPIDPMMESLLPSISSSSFVSSYLTCPFAFTAMDRYTLLIPQVCPTFDDLVTKTLAAGNSSYDRFQRTDALIQLERIMKNHMIPYRILLSQLTEEITLESKQTILVIDKEGYINHTTNRIEKCLELEHATILLCTFEIITDGLI